ncbi:hypothetical protein RHOSPDRAFT_27120 [Rhodotorula sp. JG-1b]|nr:hypothetical protein RHOSPDRAFT_27120 [Rhodotorula sp. JG-1b]
MVRLAFALAVVASAFHDADLQDPTASLVQANSFDRRQTLGGGGNSLSEVQGLMSLATNVANDIANGNATSACSNWVTALQACAPNPTTANSTAVAICACGSNVLTSLSSCAPAYGSTGTSEASETLPNLVGSASATASQTSSSMTTSTRTATGAASSTSSPASQITSSGVTGTAAANQAPSASASATSGAGRVTAITTGAVAGAVVSLLIAFAF